MEQPNREVTAMKQLRRMTLVGLWVGAWWIALWARPAEAAYLDPNAGGMLFQVLATVFALFSGFILLFARQIRMFLARMGREVRARLGRPDSPETQGDSSPRA